MAVVGETLIVVPEKTLFQLVELNLPPPKETFLSEILLGFVISFVKAFLDMIRSLQNQIT